MNKYRGLSKILFMLLLLVTFVTGCGKDNNDNDNDHKAITAYSLNGAVGVIDEGAKTIVVTMPNGTNLAAVVATFTATGAGVEVDSVPQISGETANNFTSTGSLEYTVTAADTTTAIYTVTVVVAENSAKALTAYSLNGATGIINKSAQTIAVTLPNGTSPLALVATFTTTGNSVAVGAVPQVSGTTANDFIFATPLDYTVTAVDGTTAQYSVTVTEAAVAAKEITSYSIGRATGVIDGDTILVTVPDGTDLTTLVATFTTTGKYVEVGTVPQIQTSGITGNNFTADVEYTVTATDNTTMVYTVTVIESLAQGPLPVDLGTAGNFVILAKSGVSTTGTTAVVGDIGVSPAAASYITGFNLIADSTNTFSRSSLVTGKIYASNYTSPTPANMTTAVSDMETAFTDAAGRADTDYTELYAGDISGQTLVPGLYKWSTGVLITNAGVTLEGGADDVWIFQIAQDLTVNNSAIVTLSGGAEARNIFWQVSGQVTLGTAADFKGIILSQTLISFNTGAKLLGRALAQTAVTLNATAITAPVE